jgi:glycosyltransferase involved in cell wall biosynthesis
MNPLAMDTPMKVLHPITRLIVGGAQENTLYTAQYLNPDLYSVQVITGPQTGSEGSLLTEASIRGINLTILPELVREISPKNDAVAFMKLVKLLKRDRYAIVHTHSSKAGILGRLAARRARIPVIVHTVHGWSFHDHMHPILRLVYIFLEKLVYRYTDAMIFVSQKDIERGKFTKILTKQNYYLIRSAIPLDLFDPTLYSQALSRDRLGIPANVPVLGNVGRFSAQKDPLSWIRVAAQVHAIIPECYFLLVGDGPLKGQVLQAIKEFDLGHRVILTGLRRDVPELLSAMDVFLLTSLWEGLPRVVPQALAMGLPVVSNQVDGISDAVIDGQTGFLARPGDTQALATHCVRLLQEPSLRQMLGTNGKLFVQTEFSLERMIEQLEEIYENLLIKKQLRAG